MSNKFFQIVRRDGGEERHISFEKDEPLAVAIAQRATGEGAAIVVVYACRFGAFQARTVVARYGRASVVPLAPEADQ